jgi:recombination protein RecA
LLAEAEWRIEALAGRLVEVSGSAPTATLTAAASLILEAQPDFAASGIDLNALPVIRAPDEKKAWRATDTLLRSGGFAVVVFDLGYETDFPLAVQTRLAGLARKHHTVLLCITRKGRQVPSLGSLVSIRAEVGKRRADFDRFSCELRVVKDKRQGPGWRHSEVCRGPDGLC